MPSNDTIWVLEDDQGMQFAYQQLLSNNYTVALFGTIADLTNAVHNAKTSPTLLVADLRLPDGFFLDVLRSGSISSIPCIVVSSLDDMEVLRQSFDLGANDYLTKPFAANELLLKIERLLARVEQPVVLDVRTFSVTVGERGTVALTGKEFQILSVLHEAKASTASRSELLQRVWGKPTLETKALDVHMHNLRKKIAKLGLKVTYRRPVDYILEREDDLEA